MARVFCTYTGALGGNHIYGILVNDETDQVYNPITGAWASAPGGTTTWAVGATQVGNTPRYSYTLPTAIEDDAVTVYWYLGPAGSENVTVDEPVGSHCSAPAGAAADIEAIACAVLSKDYTWVRDNCGAVGRHSLASLILLMTNADSCSCPGLIVTRDPETQQVVFQFTARTGATKGICGIS